MCHLGYCISCMKENAQILHISKLALYTATVFMQIIKILIHLYKQCNNHTRSVNIFIFFAISLCGKKKEKYTMCSYFARMLIKQKKIILTKIFSGMNLS